MPSYTIYLPNARTTSIDGSGLVAAIRNNLPELKDMAFEYHDDRPRGAPYRTWIEPPSADRTSGGHPFARLWFDTEARPIIDGHKGTIRRQRCIDIRCKMDDLAEIVEL